LAPIALLLAACATARRPLTGPIETDRPDFTEATSTVETGHVQSEGGYTFTRDGAERAQSIGELLVRIGTTDWSELRVGVNSYDVIGPNTSRKSGMEDATLGAKIRLRVGGEEPSVVPALSLLVGTTVPTGARTLNDRTWRPEAKLAAAWHLTKRTGLSANGNYSYESDAGERFSQWASSLSLDTELSSVVGAYAEYYGFYGPAFPAKHYINAGVTRALGRDTQLDFRVGTRTNAPFPAYFTGIGLARRW